MNTERLKEIESQEIKSGSHKSFDSGACVMEMVAYLADEPWSDHPKCACPILTEYAIRLNDSMNHADRQSLKDFIPKLVNTKSSDNIQIARKRLLRWRFVTVTYPLILDIRKMPEIAENLRTFENNLESMNEAAKYLKLHKEIIRANANAYPDPDPFANAYPDADANAYPDPYPDPFAYADANTYAYANADPDAYANAYTLRTKIKEVSLETLELAIEVKE